MKDEDEKNEGEIAALASERAYTRMYAAYTTHELLVFTLRRLDEIAYRLDRIFKGETIMGNALDDLTAAVTNETNVEQSAIKLIQGLASQLAAAATDPVKVSALALQINANATALAQAITANTPATSTPTTTPAA